MARWMGSSIGGGLGWGLGMGVALVATGAFGGGLRPLAKGAMKAGLAIYEHGAGKAAEASELVQDLYHEAREERMVEQLARDGRAPAHRATTEVFVIPADH